MSTSKLPAALLLLGLGALALPLPAQANQAPEVRGHSETIGAGRHHAGWIWARDAEGDRITFAITRQPRHGTITLDWNAGRYEYKPNGSPLEDDFEYRATDGNSWSGTAKVTLIMLAADGSSGNRAPEAASQALQVDAGQPLQGSVWGRDPDGHPITFTVIDWPRQGRLQLDDKSGRFSYTAYRDQSGSDMFSYRVSDGRATSTIAQVKLELRAGTGGGTPTPPQDPPLDPNIRSKADFSPLVREVLDNSFFTESFDHGRSGRLEAVAAAIDFLSRQKDIADADLDTLLYYLRAYNYYLGLGQASVAQQKMVEQALWQVSRLDSLLVYQKASAKVIEGYVVALGGLSGTREGGALVVRHLPRLIELLNHFNSTPSLSAESAYGTALFEFLNLLDRFGWAQGELAQALLGDSRLLGLLADLGSGRNAMWRNNDGFIIYNVIEALGKLQRLANGGSWRSQGDQAVRRVMAAHLGQGRLDDLELKSNFRTYYVAQAYRDSVDASCEQLFPGLCHAYQIADVLPQTHTCSASLKVRSQALTSPRLGSICSSLAQQETDFHRIMQTNWQPVADDYNSSLELVVFSSSDEYKKYAGLLYGVSTDNGGIYIEGNPASPQNQARFFAYERSTPSWQVWNLNHEYVHYQDGRFIQYGPFGHYPLNLTTWWAEGLAEYMAWGSHFERGMDDISTVAPQRRPSLSAIVNLSYESGSSMVYHWSYTLHRYLQEVDPQRHLALAQYLKVNDLAGYRRALNELEQVHGSQYPAWRDRLIADWQTRPRSMASIEQDQAEHEPHATARQRMIDPSASLARPPLD
jgi:hypothetical protein